jgi:hypothetical protein
MRPLLREAALLGAALVALGAAAFPVRADPHMSVGGAVTPGSDALHVRLDLGNSGDKSLDGPIQVVGWLFGQRDEARLDEAIAPGQTKQLPLSFPPDVPRPGVHALTLLVSYSSQGVATSQCAYLLLGLGGTPEPAVRLSVGEAVFELRGSLEVGLESADGSAHDVRLHVETPHGLRAEDPAAPVAVPAEGHVTARIPLLRVGAAHGSHHGVVVAAEAVDGPQARTSVATAIVHVLPDPAVLPRIRGWLFGAGLLLLLASAFVELRRLVRRRA